MVKIKVSKKGWFFSGVAILLLMIISYFVKIKIDDGSNYVTYDSVLGMIIFHNPFILGLYLLIVINVIVFGLKGRLGKKR